MKFINSISEVFYKGILKGIGASIVLGMVVLTSRLMSLWFGTGDGSDAPIKLSEATVADLTYSITVGVGVAFFIVRLLLDEEKGSASKN